MSTLSRSSQRRKLLNIVAAFSCIVGGIAIAWVLKGKPSSADEVAERALLAGLSGDADTLLSLQHEHEKNLLPLTKDQVKDLLSYSRSSLMPGAKTSGQPVRTLYGTGHQGEASILLTDGKRNVEISMIADATPRGPRICLSSFFLMALTARTVFDGKSSEGMDWRVHRTAVAETLSVHAKELEIRGLKGFVGNHPDSTLITLQSYIANRGGALTQR